MHATSKFGPKKPPMRASILCLSLSGAENIEDDFEALRGYLRHKIEESWISKLPHRIVT